MRCKPGDRGRTFFCDLLSSQLDADRLDYLLRDNLMTGSGYGDYDLGWLLHAFTVDPASNRLAVTWKGVSAVEAYLQSRYHMYRNVYFHKVVRSAEGMVKLALQRARRLAIQGRLPWPPRDNVVYKALTGQRMTMAEFTDLDDVSVTHCFKLWASADDVPLAALCRGLLFRRVYKTIDLTHLAGGDCGTDAALAIVVAAARAAVAAAGGDPAYDLFYDEPADTPYEAYSPAPAGGGADEILVQDAAGQAHAVRGPLAADAGAEPPAHVPPAARRPAVEGGGRESRRGSWIGGADPGRGKLRPRRGGKETCECGTARSDRSLQVGNPGPKDPA